MDKNKKFVAKATLMAVLHKALFLKYAFGNKNQIQTCLPQEQMSRTCRFFKKQKLYYIKSLAPPPWTKILDSVAKLHPHMDSQKTYPHQHTKKKSSKQKNIKEDEDWKCSKALPAVLIWRHRRLVFSFLVTRRHCRKNGILFLVYSCLFPVVYVICHGE